jgi:NifU-like protein involved in Fe-S cluster formation
MDTVRKKLLSDMGFSKKAIGILDQNLNMGTMKDPSITQQHQGSCGDILFLSLKISDNVIQDSMYEYIGCAGLQSCASALTEMIKKKSVSEARTFTFGDIISYLEGIPKQKYECAEIAYDTLQQDLDDWENPALKTI